MFHHNMGYATRGTVINPNPCVENVSAIRWKDWIVESEFLVEDRAAAGAYPTLFGLLFSVRWHLSSLSFHSCSIVPSLFDCGTTPFTAIVPSPSSSTSEQSSILFSALITAARGYTPPAPIPKINLQMANCSNVVKPPSTSLLFVDMKNALPKLPPICSIMTNNMAFLLPNTSPKNPPINWPNTIPANSEEATSDSCSSSSSLLLLLLLLFSSSNLLAMEDTAPYGEDVP
mmetsp:Transcript_23305/g.44189  ORF Transcript_23305/g.44189 Transcript_23305/m.44189 type:complete len:230 (-) Transcript_23305:4346-5035(-)